MGEGGRGRGGVRGGEEGGGGGFCGSDGDNGGSMTMRKRIPESSC